jgi:hypothetical protein
MEDYLNEKALARLPGRKYAQSEASEKMSVASGAFREEVEASHGWVRERSYGPSQEQNSGFTSSGGSARTLRDDKG